MPARANIAVFISGRGTGLQALIDATIDGTLSAKIVLVVSSSPDALGLTRAKDAGIPTFVYNVKSYQSPLQAEEALLSRLLEERTEYVALAGYLKMIPSLVLRAFPQKVVNIHPALLPKYGGKGMYGHFVHEAVLAAHETESGVTVHLVDEIYDHGKILEQVRVPVLADDTPDSLAKRVLEQEHKLYPMTIEKLIQGKYGLNHV
jgi:formyltetrahydrofolate-dependent phosphoribosylglycinamide formyltransferase